MNKRKAIQKELRREIGSKEYVIETYGVKQKNIKKKNGSGRRGNVLVREIALSCGFEELRRKLEDFEEMKACGSNGDIERQEEIENQPPTTQEGKQNERRTEFFGKRRKLRGPESKPGTTRNE